MKLICDKHRHRVHVFPVPVPNSKDTYAVTVHRKDGSRCDSTFLRLGTSKEADVFVAEQVVDARVPVRALAGYQVQPGGRKRGKQKRPHRYAVNPHVRKIVELPSL